MQFLPPYSYGVHVSSLSFVEDVCAISTRWGIEALVLEAEAVSQAVTVWISPRSLVCAWRIVEFAERRILMLSHVRSHVHLQQNEEDPLTCREGCVVDHI